MQKRIAAMPLPFDRFRPWIETFNARDEESIKTTIPNAEAARNDTPAPVVLPA